MRFLHSFLCAFFIAAVARAEFAVEEISIADLESAYASGKATVREVVQAHLDRIAAYDKSGPMLGSIIVLNPHALAEADRLDAAFKTTGKLTGPLHGVPVLIKDNYDVAGLQTTGGSAALLGWVPSKDSTAVAKLRAAGAIVLAKTTMTEWARGGYDNINSVLPGFARNPYNTAFATGGSSGGTGNGVAASFGVAGLGSDTWGSIRNPSSNNALVGLRPSRGLVSRSGMIGLYEARDTAGPMARSVSDLALMLDAIAGPDPLDPSTRRAVASGEGGSLEAAAHIPPTFTSSLKKDGLKGKRLGVLRAAFPPDKSDPQVTALLDRAIADLRRVGAEIIDPFVIPGFDEFPSKSHPQSEVRAALETYLATTGPSFPKTLADVLASKKFHAVHEVGLIAASKAPAPKDDPIVAELEAFEIRMRAAYLSAMDGAKIDALVLPVATYPPKLNGDRATTPAGATTWIASGLHWPAAVVPMGYTYENLPSGLQIIGRPWSDAALIEIAYAYEQATHHRRPPPSTPPLAASLASKFIGTWNLVGLKERDLTSGTEKDSARWPATGQLVYAANGRLSVQIQPLSRGAAPNSPAEMFTSYFGRWSLLPAETCVIHEQDGNLNAAQIGQAAKRGYTFDADGHLSLTTPPRKRDDGHEVVSVIIWERLP